MNFKDSFFRAVIGLFLLDLNFLNIDLFINYTSTENIAMSVDNPTYCKKGVWTKNDYKQMH